MRLKLADQARSLLSGRGNHALKTLVRLPGMGLCSLKTAVTVGEQGFFALLGLPAAASLAAVFLVALEGLDGTDDSCWSCS